MTDETQNTNESETGKTEAETSSTEAAKTEETVLGSAETEKTEAKPGEAKTEEKTEAKAETTTSAAPEKYELKVSDDQFKGIDTDVLAEAEPTLRELNLSNEQAQKLMPLAESLVKKTMDRAEAAITDRAIQNRKEWADAFDADPEIGGANKAQTIADAAKAFDHYGLKKGEGLRLLLDESGLGNHPDLIRFVAAVGRDTAEGTHDRGSAATTPKTPEGALYGPEFQAKG